MSLSLTRGKAPTVRNQETLILRQGRSFAHPGHRYCLLSAFQGYLWTHRIGENTGYSLLRHLEEGLAVLGLDSKTALSIVINS